MNPMGVCLKMRKRLKLGRPSHGTVVAYLALFVAIGGSAYAAKQLPKNSVGSKQIRKNAVKTSDIARNAVKVGKLAKEAVKAGKLAKNAVPTNRLRDNAVTTAKLGDGSVNSAKVEDGSLTGSDINQGSLNNVRAGNVSAISITNDGNCSPALPLPSGVGSIKSSEGVCTLTFPSPIAGCVATATAHYRPKEGLILLAHVDRTAAVVSQAGKPNALEVNTYVNEKPTDLPFDLVLVC